ncbi:unnamed protein product [Urochloa humidicola]
MPAGRPSVPCTPPLSSSMDSRRTYLSAAVATRSAARPRRCMSNSATECLPCLPVHALASLEQSGSARPATQMPGRRRVGMRRRPQHRRRAWRAQYPCPRRTVRSVEARSHRRREVVHGAVGDRPACSLGAVQQWLRHAVVARGGVRRGRPCPGSPKFVAFDRTTGPASPRCGARPGHAEPSSRGVLAGSGARTGLSASTWRGGVRRSPALATGMIQRSCFCGRSGAMDGRPGPSAPVDDERVTAVDIHDGGGGVTRVASRDSGDGENSRDLLLSSLSINEAVGSTRQSMSTVTPGLTGRRFLDG